MRSRDHSHSSSFLLTQTLRIVGIWDCQSSQAVIEFVRRGIAAKQNLDKICENMMDNCLASNSETGGVGCDNMTMIIIGFLRGRSKEEWYEEIARRVANGDGPCAPPEYGMRPEYYNPLLCILFCLVADACMGSSAPFPSFPTMLQGVLTQASFPS